MGMQIDTFTETLFGKEYTLLSVLTSKGYSVGVAPISLDDVILNAIENEQYHKVVHIDEKYGYVLEDEIIEQYLNDNIMEDIYYHLNDVDADDNLFVSTNEGE
jgi:hypothetical protein